MADEMEPNNYYDDDNYENDYDEWLYNDNANEVSEPVINTMTNAEINEFDLKNDSHMGLIYRRMIAGQCFRLPDSPTCPDDVFESWISTYLSDLSDDPKEKMKSFRYTWTQERQGVHGVPVPKFYAASKVTELAVLVDKLNISRTDIKLVNGAEPTKTNWTETLQLQVFTLTKIDKNDSLGIAADILKTEDKYSLVLDGIIHYITGKYYFNSCANTPGLATKTYFDEAESNLKALKAVYREGNNTLTIDLVNSFKNGTYPNYKATIAAVNRRYKRGLTQETMIDWFRKIDLILSRNNPTEFKIQHLRTLISDKLVTDPDQFPLCSDFEGDQYKQKYPEEYNPMINTLLTYITFNNQLKRNDWDTVQRLYHQEIKGKVTYKSWHENRSELYRVMDEFQSSKHISQIESQNENINVIRRNQYRPRGGQIRGSNPRLYRPPQRQIRQPVVRRPNPPPIRPRVQNPTPGNLFGRPQNNAQGRLRRLLCMHCSRIAGTNKYHHGPWGGGPNSKCPYDRNGQFRPGYNFIGRIDGQPVDHILVQSYEEAEHEGIEYESNEVNHIDCQGNYMVAHAMGDIN